MPATRREVLEALERLWDRYLDMRLGQLVANIGVLATGKREGAEAVYDMEADEIIEAITRHLGPE